MNKIKSYIILTVGFITSIFAAQGQNQNSMKFLNANFPTLTGLYSHELANMHTHYIFAVDVSGSMKKYNNVVTPALQAFADALPDGERVSVIPFGTEAKTNSLGLCAVIDRGTRQVLRNSLSELYTNSSHTPEFKKNTDVAKAVDAVNKTILNHQDMSMNVVVIITDFLNDIGGEKKLDNATLSSLNQEFEAVTDDTYTRVVAMKLPPAGSGKGFCLNQLQTDVYYNTNSTRKFEVVDVISNQGLISDWFTNLSKEIMTDKLRAVVQLDNARNLNPCLDLDIDIDGDTKAEFHWQPNKLYKTIKIDSTYTAENSDLYFVNNKKAWGESTDTDIEIEDLGQLRNKSWGLHRYNDTINIGLSLPTACDSELQKLGIDKPIPNTNSVKSGWLWTFPLPFWLSVTLLILLIIYIIGIINAMRRNAKEKFSGTVNFQRPSGALIASQPVKNKAGNVNFGNGSSFDVPGGRTDWTVTLTKIKSNPFLPWTKPKYRWKASRGYAKSGSKQSGFISRYGQARTSKKVSLECGPDRDHITHRLEIKINSK